MEIDRTPGLKEHFETFRKQRENIRERYPIKLKQMVVRANKNGYPISDIHRDTEVPEDTLIRWTNNKQKPATPKVIVAPALRELKIVPEKPQHSCEKAILRIADGVTIELPLHAILAPILDKLGGNSC